MASKKKKHRRKTFKFPTEGPLYETDDEWTVAGANGLPTDFVGDHGMPDEAMPNEADARAHQLEMLRSVFAFEQLAWRGFKTILMSILFFGVGSSIVGGLLGLAFPNYCRFIFNAFDRVDFNPWAGGLAHGLVLGCVAGAVIGCVVVFSVAHYQSRSWKNMQADRDQS